MQISGSMRCWRATTTLSGAADMARSAEAHVFEVRRLLVDARDRRRDPVRVLARLGDAAHQRLHELSIALRWQPVARAGGPFGLAHDLALRRHLQARERPDLPMERLV